MHLFIDAYEFSILLYPKAKQTFYRNVQYQLVKELNGDMSKKLV